MDLHWMKELKNKKYLPIALGVCGLAILLISSMFSTEKTKAENVDGDTVTYTVSDYTKQLEKRLEQCISELTESSNCNVMITLKSTEQSVYAKSINKTTEGKESLDREQIQEEYVILNDTTGRNSALMESVELPKINGVLVICEGASDVQLRKNILDAVSTVLGIASNKVCVLESK